MRVTNIGEIGRRCRIYGRSSQYVSRLYPEKLRKRWVHYSTDEGLRHKLTHGTNAETQSDDDFLRRASKYGIRSLQELEQQSRYLNRKDLSQLVQNDSFRSDMNLWQLLLDYQAYYHGAEGVESIYKLLRWQGPIVKLSPESETTSALWRQMLVIAARDTRSFGLFDQLCERYGIAWGRPKLFAEAIAILLESNKIHKTLSMCNKMLEISSSKLDAAIHILLAFRPKHTADLVRFLAIYHNLQPLRLYDKAMEALWQSNRYEEAVLLHKLLISEGDVPSSFHHIGNLMLYLAKHKIAPTSTISQLLDAEIDYGHRALHVYKAAQQKMAASEKEDVTKASDQAHAESKRMSETFAAKAFATSALPFEFVLNSLKAFGLTEVGPQTIREIGLVAKDLDTLRNRLDLLRKRGIDTGASAYVRTVRTLCKKGHAALLAEVLQTDIHHDVFEDAHLQWHLISDHVKKCDWSKVNMLLTIMCHGSIGGQAANMAKTALLLEPNRTDNRHRAFLNFATQVHGSYRASEMFGTRSTIQSMIRDMRFHKRDRFTPFQQLTWAKFMAGLMQEAVLGGQRFEVFEWRHVISRIGGNGMPDLAIGLIYWIVRLQHGARSNADEITPISLGALADNAIRISNRPTPLNKPEFADTSTRAVALRPLSRLFDRRLQKSLMHWSLQHSLHKKTPEPRQPWQTCLEMLRLLEQEYAIPIDLDALKEVIVIRCRYLRRQHSCTKTRYPSNNDEPRTDKNSFEENRERNRAAWRACSQVIGELHNLWLVRPEGRSADLDTAFAELMANKSKSTRPFQKRKGISGIDDRNYAHLGI